MPDRIPSLAHPEGLLAHYTTAEAAFEHIVPTRRLKMNPYRKMRDPTENRVIVPNASLGPIRMPPFRLNSDGGPSAMSPDMTEVRHALAHRLMAVRDEVRLASFTAERPAAPERTRANFQLPRMILSVFNCAWYRPRMWEQYGGNHRGVCLLFDRDTLVAEVGRRLPLAIKDGYVKYSPEGAVGNRLHFDDRVLDPTARDAVIANYVDEHAETFFFCKVDDFATEFEYRIVLPAASMLPEPEGEADYEIEPDGSVNVGYGEALTAVVVGHEFPDWQIAGARRVCRDAGMTLGRLVWDNGCPSVCLPPHE